MMKSHERPTSWNMGSFVAIANLVYDPAVFATRPNGKYQTLAEIVVDAKKRPGEIPISSAGAGSNTHLDLIAFEEAAKIKLLHVPYEGGGQSRTALLGGHVEVVASALGDVQRFIEQGQLKALAIGSKTRFPLAPNIPTFIEQGFQVVGGSSRGLVAPKGTPQEYIDALAQATEKALKDPELIKKANDIALPLEFMGPAAYSAYLRPRTRSLRRCGSAARGCSDQPKDHNVTTAVYENSAKKKAQGRRARAVHGGEPDAQRGSAHDRRALRLRRDLPRPRAQRDLARDRGIDLRGRAHRRHHADRARAVAQSRSMPHASSTPAHRASCCRTSRTPTRRARS